MEPIPACGGPLEFQLAAKNWTAEEAPPAGSISTCSSSLHPAYAVPASNSSSSGGKQQLVEYMYNAAAAAQHNDPSGKPTTTTQEADLSSSSSSFDEMEMEKQFLKATNEFNYHSDSQFIKTKMHRYPPSIRDLGDLCTVPNIVAIGPYHRHHNKLKPAEQVKHVAAHHCIEKSGLSFREMYRAVTSAAVEIDARGLYDKDVMEAIDDKNEFLPMMFRDACFLVMYMLKNSLQMNFDAVLFDFFESKDRDIAHDIMLLENQIPWPLVDAVRKKMKNSGHFLEEFIAYRRDSFQLNLVSDGPSHVQLDENYEPPHLLGLLRFYTVGRRTRRIRLSDSTCSESESLQVSVNPMDLAEMGIHLTANRTTKLPDMGLARKWIIFAELSVPQLSLDDSNTSLLVNMAAHELCTILDFLDPTEDPKFEDTAVCSYLLLVSMLMYREEDVHELRKKGILQGGAGLTNKKVLNLFTSLQSLRRGLCFSFIMAQIQIYKDSRPWITVYTFVYRNWKFVSGIVSAIVGIATIAKTLQSLKGGHH